MTPEEKIDAIRVQVWKIREAVNELCKIMRLPQIVADNEPPAVKPRDFDEFIAELRERWKAGKL